MKRKPTAFSLCIAVALGAATLSLATNDAKAQLITSLTDLGTSSFLIDVDSTTAPHSQSLSGITFSGSMPLGATLGGFFTTGVPKDWSSYSLNDFGLMMSLSGVNPEMPFTLELYDSELNVANTFVGSTAGIGTSSTFTPLTLSSAGFGTMNDIVGIQFSWDSSDSINVEWQEIAVVPEPKTVTLLLSSLLGIALFKLIRSKKILTAPTKG